MWCPGVRIRWLLLHEKWCGGEIFAGVFSLDMYIFVELTKLTHRFPYQTAVILHQDKIFAMLANENEGKRLNRRTT